MPLGFSKIKMTTNRFMNECRGLLETFVMMMMFVFFLVFILFRYYPTPSVGDFGTKNDPIYRLHRHFSRTYFPHLVERNSFK